MGFTHGRSAGEVRVPARPRGRCGTLAPDNRPRGRPPIRLPGRAPPGHPDLGFMANSDINKIAFVGDYLPRKCGIATFTHDMRRSVAARRPEAECFVVPVNDRPGGYDYPPEVRFEIDEQDLDGYLRAADFLNFANTAT